MANQTTQKIKSLKSNWAVWLFPIVALVISGWIFYGYYKKRGPTITITFEDAAGLQSGKTRVRFRGVSIGLVQTVTLSEDTKDVIATIKLQREAERFAVEGTKFWVVTPKVSFQGISGLETLVDGTYVAAQPGPEDANTKLDFKGSMNSESTDALENTSVYFLETSNAESVSEGDAVTFRGLNVGTVTKVTLAKNSKVVVIQLNIQNKYAKLIRTNTWFWRKIGVQADLGLFGSKIKINSMDSILRGGVEVFTPDNAGPRAKAGARYNLSTEPPKGYEKWNPELD